MTPTDWSTVALGTLVGILDHKRVPVSAHERASRPGSVPYFGATGQVGWIDRPLFEEPLLLLGEDGVQFFDRDKPKAYLIDGPSWVNNHAHVLRPHSDVVDRRFLRYYLDNVDYHGLANGTTRLKLTKSAMCRIPIHLPHLDEQHRIVEILEDHLSRLEAAAGYISDAHRHIDLLRASTLASIWDESLALGPPGTVSELGPVITGSTPRDRALRGEEPQLPFVTPGDVSKGQKIEAVARSVPEDAHARSRVLRSAAVIAVCIGATLGKIGWTDSPVATNQQINAVLVGENSAPFVALLMASPAFQSQMRDMASATTMPILSKRLFSKLNMPLPRPEHQQRLLEKAESVLVAGARASAASEASERKRVVLRRALLAAAFSGRLTGHSTDNVEELAGV